MGSPRRRQVLGLVLAVVGAGTALWSTGVVRAGPASTLRVPVIQLDAVPGTPSGPEPGLVGTGPARVVEPAPVPAGPDDDRARDDDVGDDADDAGDDTAGGDRAGDDDVQGAGGGDD